MGLFDVIDGGDRVILIGLFNGMIDGDRAILMGCDTFTSQN